MPSARRASKCPSCGAQIECGSQIAKLPRGSTAAGRWAHRACADADAAAIGVNLADIAHENLCRHWKEQGICGFGESCSFLHPPEYARRTQVVIGLGTGRCGTLSLARLLSLQPNSRVQHEPEVDSDLFRWDASAAEKESRVNRQYVDFNAWHRQLVGAVHYVYLPYVDAYIKRDPLAKFIVLERPRHEVIESYLRKSGGVNHWQPGAAANTRWALTYPTFDTPGLSKAEAIGLYWDLYKRKVEELLKAHPTRVRRYSHFSVLNHAATQEEMLRWLGVTEPILELGVVHNRSSATAPLQREQALLSRTGKYSGPEPEPEPEPEPQAGTRQADEEDEDEDAVRHQTQEESCDLQQSTHHTQSKVTTADACAYQHYSSPEAWERWHTKAPLRHVDYRWVGCWAVALLLTLPRPGFLFAVPLNPTTCTRTYGLLPYNRSFRNHT